MGLQKSEDFLLMELEGKLMTMASPLHSQLAPRYEGVHLYLQHDKAPCDLDITVFRSSPDVMFRIIATNKSSGFSQTLAPKSSENTIREIQRLLAALTQNQ